METGNNPFSIPIALNVLTPDTTGRGHRRLWTYTTVERFWSEIFNPAWFRLLYEAANFSDTPTPFSWKDKHGDKHRITQGQVMQGVVKEAAETLLYCSLFAPFYHYWHEEFWMDSVTTTIDGKLQQGTKVPGCDVLFFFAFGDIEAANIISEIHQRLFQRIIQRRECQIPDTANAKIFALLPAPQKGFSGNPKYAQRQIREYVEFVLQRLLQNGQRSKRAVPLSAGVLGQALYRLTADDPQRKLTGASIMEAFARRHGYKERGFPEKLIGQLLQRYGATCNEETVRKYYSESKNPLSDMFERTAIRKRRGLCEQATLWNLWLAQQFWHIALLYHGIVSLDGEDSDAKKLYRGDVYM